MENGELLWENQSTRRRICLPRLLTKVDGRQYVVIACGGGKMGTESGDLYMAFALEP